jgi:hypothetical protein
VDAAVAVVGGAAASCAIANLALATQQVNIRTASQVLKQHVDGLI